MTEAETLVRELYKGVLRREPDPKWLNQHVQRLQEKGIEGELSELIQYFMKTEEFRKKFTEQNVIEQSQLINSSRIHLLQANQQFAKSLKVNSKLLDVGAGDQPYRQLFSHVRYESADFEVVNKPYGRSTYVCDVCERIPVEDQTFDYILCNQTLEHLREPQRALNEMFRVLRRGGRIFCTAPLFYEEHEVPHDYFRYTRYGLSYLFTCSGFEIEKIECLEGFFGTCGYMLESMYRYMPWQWDGAAASKNPRLRAFLGFMRPFCLWAAGMFYELDSVHKIDDTGFPKNYAVSAKKP
jgi:SAM-dependent methyltransferase